MQFAVDSTLAMLPWIVKFQIGQCLLSNRLVPDLGINLSKRVVVYAITGSKQSLAIMGYVHVQAIWRLMCLYIVRC